MPALRANTMQRRMPSNSSQEKPSGLVYQARAALSSANGRAKSVWLKRIISRMSRTRCNTATALLTATQLDSRDSVRPPSVPRQFGQTSQWHCPRLLEL